MAAHILKVPLTALAAAGMLMGATACAPLEGVLGDVIADGRGSVVQGEVRSLDDRRGRLQVRDDYDRRDRTINYDSRTRVYYQSRQYSASALRRGDVVRVQLSRDRNGQQWADRIDVRESARGSAGSVDTRVQRTTGTVRDVDTRRRIFLLERSRTDIVTVTVPSRASSGDVRRFERLRRGERVDVELRAGYTRGQAELVRFR